MRVQHTTAAISLTLWVSLLVGCGADPEGPANAGRDTALPDAGQDTNDGGMDASETDNDLVTVNWNVVGINPQDVTVTVSLAGAADAGSVWTGTADQPAELQPGRYSIKFEAEGFTPYSFELVVPPDGDIMEAPPTEMEPEADPCEDDVVYYEIADYLWTVPDTAIEDRGFYVVPEGGVCVLYDENDVPRLPDQYRYSGGDTMELGFGALGFETAYGTPR